MNLKIRIMERLRMNIYRDCIVDENNQIVAERPRFISDWIDGDKICEIFNKLILEEDI